MPDQNTIRVWRNPATDAWHARIGADDETGREAEGVKPVDAVCSLLVLLQWDGYPFDATPPPAKAE